MSIGLKEKIEVMQHFIKGGDIQFKPEGKDWTDWDLPFIPNFNWGCIDYRIKPKKETRLMTAQEVLGNWLVLDEDNMFFVSEIDNGEILAIRENYPTHIVRVHGLHKKGWKWNTTPTLDGAKSLMVEV